MCSRRKKNSPASFARCLKKILPRAAEYNISLYVDDIQICSRTWEEHLAALKYLFSSLLAAGLTLRLDKCHFAKDSAKILGFIVSQSGISVDPDRTDAITRIAPPRTAKELRRFLGAAGYLRKFIPNFSHTAKPLHDLLKKDAPFRWSETHKVAFEEIKRRIISPPTLSTPTPEGKFVLTCDASNFACGAFLSQLQGGVLKPIAYYSKSFSDSEMRQSATVREGLSCVYACEKFRTYLEGTTFDLITDHEALKSLNRLPDAHGTIGRLAIRLQAFDYNVVYRPGKTNLLADMLSRPTHCSVSASCPELRNTTPEPRAVDVKPESPAADSQPHIPTPTLPVTLPPVRAPAKIPEDEVLDGLVNLFDDAPRENSPCTVPASVLSRGKTRGKDNALCLLNVATATVPPDPKPRCYPDGSVVPPQECDRNCLIALQKADDESAEIYAFLSGNRDKMHRKTLKRAKRQAQRFCIDDDILYHKQRSEKRIFLPSSLRSNVLKLAHDSPMAGHFGCNRTLLRISSRYYWRNMHRDVRAYVLSCTLCQTSKPDRTPTKGHMLSLKHEKPFHTVYIDHAGPYPTSGNKNKYILVIVDGFSRYCELIACPNSNALTTAKALVKHLWARHGSPVKIISDMGPAYKSNLWKNICSLLKIEYSYTTPFFPQANRAERVINDLLPRLRMFASSHSRWDEDLDILRFALNTAPNSSAGFSPYQIINGRSPRDPLDIVLDDNEIASDPANCRIMVSKSPKPWGKLIYLLARRMTARRHLTLHITTNRELTLSST